MRRKFVLLFLFNTILFADEPSTESHSSKPAMTDKEVEDLEKKLCTKKCDSAKQEGTHLMSDLLGSINSMTGKNVKAQVAHALKIYPSKGIDSQSPKKMFELGQTDLKTILTLREFDDTAELSETDDEEDSMANPLLHYLELHPKANKAHYEIKSYDLLDLFFIFKGDTENNKELVAVYTKNTIFEVDQWKHQVGHSQNSLLNQTSCSPIGKKNSWVDCKGISFALDKEENKTIEGILVH